MKLDLENTWMATPVLDAMDFSCNMDDGGQEYELGDDDEDLLPPGLGFTRQCLIPIPSSSSSDKANKIG